MGIAPENFEMNTAIRFALGAMEGLDHAWSQPGFGGLSDDLARTRKNAYRSARLSILAWVYTQGFIDRDDMDPQTESSNPPSENDHDHQ